MPDVTPAQIEAYLRDCVELVESMRDHGYREQPGDDDINVAVTRDGSMVKTSAGRKRIAAARLAGVQRIPVRVANVHMAWWRMQRTRHDGPEEERLRRALEQVAADSARTPTGSGDDEPLLVDPA
jgi:hypothetical protein